jgi:hypothetical protein
MTGIGLWMTSFTFFSFLVSLLSRILFTFFRFFTCLNVGMVEEDQYFGSPFWAAICHVFVVYWLASNERKPPPW